MLGMSIPSSVYNIENRQPKQSAMEPPTSSRCPQYQVIIYDYGGDNRHEKKYGLSRK